MGVNGFWPFCARYGQPMDLAGGLFHGESWAIDSSVLLHASLAQEANARAQVIDGEPAPTQVVNDYCRALGALIDSGVRPVAVFDGAPRPDKRAEAARREASRKAAREEAQALFGSGAPLASYARVAVRATHVALPLPTSDSS